jgi:hypothetical protein
MSQINNRSSLQDYTTIISRRKILINLVEAEEPELTTEWGWFVDPELNLNFNKYKYITKKYVSIPNTIQEYPKIRSLSSMTNFQDNSIFKTDKKISKNKTNKKSVIYIARVTISLIFICLLYIFL